MLIAAAGGRCAICGYDRCAQSLHFHHVDPSRKRLELGSHSGAGVAALLDELDNCVLLCANCHGEVEAGLVASPPPRRRPGKFEPVTDDRRQWATAATRGAVTRSST
jgi:5-methylcytosine-specific restriction endonuclease McrA